MSNEFLFAESDRKPDGDTAPLPTAPLPTAAGDADPWLALFASPDARPFAAGMLAQLSDVLRVPPDAVLCGGRGGGAVAVLAGVGRHAEAADRPVQALDPAIAAGIVETSRTGRAVYGAEGATLCIPLPDGAFEQGGAVAVVWIRTDRPLDAADRRLAELFASKIALGFANLALHERLREAGETLERRVGERTRALAEANARLNRLATLDALTGVWNRRRFLDLAEAELGRARRYGRQLGVFLLDLDRFKTINDTHGHAAGDEVLRAVVKRTREALRASDHIARFGGEEFVVLLPETDGDGTTIVAERVRASLAAAPVVVDGRPIPITASIGIAWWLPGEASMEATLRRADLALHAAKQAGRNRVQRSDS